ncbi:hypothetical protein PO124_22160 [Bacillus licheniformis]|nr:hypothetical protein [Bacillus licheniformis]
MRAVFRRRGSESRGNGFDYLESNHLYAAVEELALDAAQYYNQIERLKDSIFTMKVRSGKSKIKGEMRCMKAKLLFVAVSLAVVLTSSSFWQMRGKPLPCMRTNDHD